jgi:hypothetical protein
LGGELPLLSPLADSSRVAAVCASSHQGAPYSALHLWRSLHATRTRFQTRPPSGLNTRYASLSVPDLDGVPNEGSTPRETATYCLR